MKMNIKMRPRGCVIQKSHPGLYPKAGFGSGNLGNLLFSTREAVSNSDAGQEQFKVFLLHFFGNEVKHIHVATKLLS